MARSCRLRLTPIKDEGVVCDGSWPVCCMRKFIRKYRNRILFFFLAARNGMNLGLEKNNAPFTPRTPLCAAAMLAQRCRATTTCLLHHSTRLACEIRFLSPKSHPLLCFLVVISWFCRDCTQAVPPILLYINPRKVLWCSVKYSWVIVYSYALLVCAPLV